MLNSPITSETYKIDHNGNYITREWEAAEALILLRYGALKPKLRECSCYPPPSDNNNKKSGGKKKPITKGPKAKKTEKQVIFKMLYNIPTEVYKIYLIGNYIIAKGNYSTLEWEAAEALIMLRYGTLNSRLGEYPGNALPSGKKNKKSRGKKEQKLMKLKKFYTMQIYQMYLRLVPNSVQNLAK